MIKLSKLHEVLAEERRQQGLSQTDIACMLNVEQATVSYYENGKRGIPLELMDNWMEILGIRVILKTKGNAPTKPSEEIRNDLEVFTLLKRRRNYLIPEMRALLASKLMQEPHFRKTNTETGENLFWAYSLGEASEIGVVETRYDHPEHRYLAVEYTEKEVNVYKHLQSSREGEGLPGPKWPENSRTYFSEDDFLTLSGQWEKEILDERKVTILRKQNSVEDGVEIVAAEGFSLRALTEMQQTFLTLRSLLGEVKQTEPYRKKEAELQELNCHLHELMLDNRYENGAMNPEFVLWNDTDKAVIDVPLWAEKRNWYWIFEGEEWAEEQAKGSTRPMVEGVAIFGAEHVSKDRAYYRGENKDNAPGIRLYKAETSLTKVPEQQRTRDTGQVMREAASVVKEQIGSTYARRKVVKEKHRNLMKGPDMEPADRRPSHFN